MALGCLCTFCWRVTPVNQTISHVREALLTRPSVIGAACQPKPVPGSARAQGAGSPGGQRRIQPRAPATTHGGEGLGPPLCCKPEAHRWVLLLAKSHARASGSLPGWLATGVGMMAPQNRAESSLRAEACCVSPPARADVGGRPAGGGAASPARSLPRGARRNKRLVRAGGWKALASSAGAAVAAKPPRAASSEPREVAAAGWE